MASFVTPPPHWRHIHTKRAHCAAPDVPLPRFFFLPWTCECEIWTLGIAFSLSCSAQIVSPALVSPRLPPSAAQQRQQLSCSLLWAHFTLTRTHFTHLQAAALVWWMLPLRVDLGRRRLRTSLHVQGPVCSQRGVQIIPPHLPFYKLKPRCPLHCAQNWSLMELFAKQIHRTISKWIQK